MEMTSDDIRLIDVIIYYISEKNMQLETATNILLEKLSQASLIKRALVIIRNRINCFMEESGV